VRLLLSLSLLLCPTVVLAQAAISAPAPPAPPPTLAEVRKEMGIPSAGDVRGQKDVIGFASSAQQMAKTWELAATTTGLERLGEPPAPGVVGALCAHDDYIYAARVYRQVLPLVTAKTVVLVGVFHKWRRFGAHDLLVFDPYRAWRAPDGEIPISPLRAEVLATLPNTDFVQDAAMSDSEHSLEAVAYWLKHARPDVEILPLIVPVAPFSRFQEIAGRFGKALAGAMRARGWQLGRDVAIVISSDAVHYGADFNYAPYGEGGVEPYLKAIARDRDLLRGPLAGVVTSEQARAFFEACVNPENPGEYRLTWCGRFAIPMGLLLLETTARELGVRAPEGRPLAYTTSVGGPELPLRPLGLGETAPANLYHFVGLPASAYVLRQ
jgi:AmmeMemoRadiSam system protein B